MDGIFRTVRHETLSRIATALKDREPISNGVLERQREWVAKAKADGKGRVPTAQRKGAEVVQLRGRA
jgi:hypothetical protein